MIQNDYDRIFISHVSQDWDSLHREERFGGPEELEIGEDNILARDASFHLDDMTDETAVVTSARAFRKGGNAVVRHEGILPFGREIVIGQTCRYAANHVRIVFDINWPANGIVRQNFDIGSLLLPGKWKRFFSLPPCAKQEEGEKPAWEEIPAEVASGTLLKEWTQPPLAVVFEREDGSRLEIGTGNDVWRWEHCLGFGPEAGNYAITMEEEGLRFQRQILKTEEEKTPEPRPYRFSWHLAWKNPEVPLPGRNSYNTDSLLQVADPKCSLSDLGKTPCVYFDPRQLQLPKTCLRATTRKMQEAGEKEDSPCWQAKGTQKAARRIIRRLAALDCEQGTLVIGPLDPGPCWDPSHFNRGKKSSLAHWDVEGLLDFAVWTRQKLGDNWDIIPFAPLADALPSLAGLFLATGFSDDLEEQEWEI